MITTLLGASVGVPYVMSQFGGAADGTQAAPNSGAVASVSSPLLAGGRYGSPTTSQGAQRTLSIDQTLRFDRTREWVYQQWGRTTIVPGDGDLLGVRVAWVSGTRRGDLAGSLTYYFDAQGRMQHLSFRGQTADPAPLVTFLTRTYEFERKAAPAGEQLLQVARGGHVHSEMRVSLRSVDRNTTPQGGYALQLEMGRPGTQRYLVQSGPSLELPPAPPPPGGQAVQSPPASAADNDADDGDSYLDQLRFATPEERNQLLRMRWPD
jgi:hypothetical protein